jgi:mannosyl-3-phosphoglycerate phosphatase family protein
VTGPNEVLRLVFTDLDGSLLDHNNYSFHDALPQLRALERLAIPVIPATSKTRTEISQLRDELANTHPFITENGAAVLIPVDYFARQPPGTSERDGFWVREFASPRRYWLTLLDEMKGSFAGEFDYFFQAGTAGISRMTGLPADKAALANQRDYSEPVLWLGSAQRKLDFMAALETRGASVQQGGRFLAVSGDCDKGRALAWLRATYLQATPGRHCQDLAVGDSGNDRAMLEAAGTALLVRSPVHDFPVLERSSGVIYSRDYGPAGWAEGVARWLHQLPRHP